MILRVYRITDKFGLVILKLTSAIGEWLFDGVGIITGIAGGFIGIIVSALMIVLGVLASAIAILLNIVKRFFQIILEIIKGILSLIVGFASRLLGIGKVGLRGASRTGNVVAQSAGQSASTSMARRAARAEIDAVVTEDPLRAQNRLLSGAFVLLSVIVIGIVLWATDPSRSFGAPVANVPSENIAGVFNSTPVPTTQSGSAIIAASPIPTATQIPEVFQIRGAIAYVVHEQGQDDIWAVNVGSRSSVRITNDANRTA